MNSSLKSSLLGLAFIAATSSILATAQADAREPYVAKRTSLTRSAKPALVEEAPAESVEQATKPTAAEIRQARAAQRSQMRIERLERNLWAGYEPLRPNWNSIPMMSSRYPQRHTVVVPLYVYPW